MKKLLLSLTAVFALVVLQGAATGVQAQSKKEQKALAKQWKKKAAAYKKNPLALKAKEEAASKTIDDLTKKNAELTERIAQMQSEMEGLESTIRRQRDSVNNLKYEMAKLRKEFEAKKTQVVTEAMPGVVYRVQIGAYEKFNIDSKLTATDENFKGDSQDNLNKFLIGKFRDYNLATAFCADIRTLGIKDAFVVAYNDGVRLPNVKAGLKMQGIETNEKGEPTGKAAGTDAGAKPAGKPAAKPAAKPAETKPAENEFKDN